MDVNRIRQLIDAGFNALPVAKKQQRAVLVIGDTGVGKSTVISFLAKKKLVVKHNGLNTVIDSQDKDGKLKIGHERYSETTVPTKIVIEDMDFFDCSGFKDNRGDDFEISNSFFLQRLFSLYREVKMFLIIDEHYISEARIDKLPKLIRNLSESFGGLEAIQDGVVLLINRAKINRETKDYCNEITKMADLKGEKHFFNDSERSFLEFLVSHNRVCIFKQAEDQAVGKVYESKEGTQLLATINQATFIKSKKVKNILSESTKLAIRDYVDDLLKNGDQNITGLTASIKAEIINSTKHQLVPTLDDLQAADGLLSSLLESLRSCEPTAMLTVLLTSLPNVNLGAIEKDFLSVLFFQDIYSKAGSYFTVLQPRLVADLLQYQTVIKQQVQVLTAQQAEIAKLKQANEKLQAEQAHLETTRKALEKETKDKDTSLKETLLTKEKLEKMLETERINTEAAVNATKQLETAFKKKEEALQAKCTEIDELNKHFINLKLELQGKVQELEIINMENETLRSEIDHLESQSVAGSVNSMASKSSKYPFVNCPHFKNGGKCKHCIKKWKDEQNV